MVNINDLDWFLQRKLVVLYIQKNLPILKIETKCILESDNINIYGMDWVVVAENEKFYVYAGYDRWAFYIDIYEKKEENFELSIHLSPIYQCSRLEINKSNFHPKFEYSTPEFVLAQLVELSEYFKEEMNQYNSLNPEFKLSSIIDIYKEIDLIDIKRKKQEKEKDSLIKNLIIMPFLFIVFVLFVLSSSLSDGIGKICNKFKKSKGF